MRQTIGTAEDWKRLQFRCGLEIHHQIDTEKKLFCHCPAGRYSDVWHAEALRHMRPTLSELGEYDGTALMEFKTRKEIIYRLNRDTVCTYEMDDNPPFLINQQAVDYALTIALALDCKIVGELHIIRKQYLDGSIPAGFQRTAIVGVDGMIPLSSGKELPIIQLGLEEDACREVSDIGHRITFYTDRLSMPLIEVVTADVLNTPEEAAEAAMRIGRLLRATGMVRRGIGAARQDVNVSIEGSTRVEIKGVPRIPRIPELTAREAFRQEGLLKLRDELRVRGFAEGDTPGEVVAWEAGMLTVSRPELQAAHASRDTVRLIRLPRAKGLLEWPLGEGRSFSGELAGRVRVIACLDQTPNLLHTDGPGGGLDDQDRRVLAEAAGCGVDDVAVVVWGSAQDTMTAGREILARFAEAIRGVPNETRQALPDNTNDFERVLPGPDRMYPDTDSPPYEITAERVEQARRQVPEMPWNRERRYLEQGLPEDMAGRLAISRFAPLHDRLVAEDAVAPLRSAEVLTRFLTALRRKGAPVTMLDADHLESLLRAMGEGRIFREGVLPLLAAWAGNPGLDLDEVMVELGWAPLNDDSLERVVRREVDELRSAELRREEKAEHVLMGRLRERFEGRVPGRQVREQLSRTGGLAPA